MKQVSLLRRVVRYRQWQNRLFIDLLLFTGARVMAILTLKLKDIDFDKNTIRIYDHKKNDSYITFINPDLKQSFEHYFTHHTDLGKMRKEDYIFENKHKLGAHIPYNTMNNRIIKKILNPVFNTIRTSNGQGQVVRFINPDRITRICMHSLRHSYASNLLKGGASLKLVQELLNHSDIATTAIYSKVDDADKVQAIENLYTKSYEDYKNDTSS